MDRLPEILQPETYVASARRVEEMKPEYLKRLDNEELAAVERLGWYNCTGTMVEWLQTTHPGVLEETERERIHKTPGHRARGIMFEAYVTNVAREAAAATGVEWEITPQKHPASMDIQIKGPGEAGATIGIECKCTATTIPKKETEKFVRDMLEQSFDGSVLVSLAPLTGTRGVAVQHHAHQRVLMVGGTDERAFLVGVLAGWLATRFPEGKKRPGVSADEHVMSLHALSQTMSSLEKISQQATREAARAKKHLETSPHAHHTTFTGDASKKPRRGTSKKHVSSATSPAA